MLTPKLSFQSSEKKLENVDRSILELQHTKAITDVLVTRIDKAEKTLKGSKKHFIFFDDEMSKQSNPLLFKKTMAIEYQYLVVVLQKICQTY